MRNLISFLPFFLISLISTAQVVGSITSDTGEELAFANVYVKNSTRGTTSNINGDYRLDLSPGKYELVFQYVGFEQVNKNIELGNDELRLDVVLKEESVGLEEVVVTTEGEDPAYAIIRKARDKRKFHLNQVKRYSADVYMKGNQQVSDVPEKIFGVEIGDMGGVLDTTGSGIVYLSESISKLHFEAPDKFKEEMISSKVSGDDNGFSFNQASAMDFNFYRNSYDEFGRPIVSPIADNCMVYYRYKLEGAFYENGRLINKIKVIRKRDTDPSLSGYLYIIEDLWNIHSVDMVGDGKAFGVSALDTLRLKQTYVPVEAEIWQPISRVVNFNLKIFGIGFDGVFTAVYSNYNIAPDLPEDYFNAEVLKVEEEANQKDSVYWDAIRPIPLTTEEVSDYAKKDSLQIVWESKEYLDSMDRKNNKFKILNLLGGYTYNNSYKKWSVGFESPISAISYNTVQGFYPNIKASFRKGLDKQEYKWFRAESNVQYGFSDKQFRGTLGWTYNANRTNFLRLEMEGGREAVQFNSSEPINDIQNSVATLMFRRNFAKYYDKYFGKFSYRQEIFNGILLNASLEYAQRNPLYNTSDYSWGFEDSRTFTSNNPLRPNEPGTDAFNSHQALTLDINIRIRFRQEYLTYPNRKIITGSKFPDFFIRYKRGLPVLGGDTDFDFVSVKMTDNFSLGRAGRSFLSLEGGAFLSEGNIPFPDRRHFNGNRVYVAWTSTYTDAFRMLDYYRHSTTDPYFKVHWDHNFGGTILGKIPGVRKLQWELTTGANYLLSETSDHYTEVFVGFDNIGFKIFRILRVDFVTAFDVDGFREFRVITGVDL